MADFPKRGLAQSCIWFGVYGLWREAEYRESGPARTPKSTVLSTCVNMCKLVSERERRSLRESRRRSERGVGREITALTDWAPPIQFHKTKRLPDR